MVKNFADLGIKDDIVASLLKVGIKMPMPVQERTIPLLLQGNDVLAQARTGTGKTLAFLLPALQKVEAKKPYAQVLVIAPTRELALQIADEARKLTNKTDVKVVSILGGRDFIDQKNKLENVGHILVGTPGRILDHVRRRSTNLSGVRFFVLDEVDEMLQRGFLDDVAELSSLVAEKRQTVVCSATLPQEVANLAKQIMKTPKFVKVDADRFDASRIDQYVVKVSDDKRQLALAAILKNTNPYLAIVFCRSKESAVEVGDWLGSQGFSSDILQGDMSQSKRQQVMRNFRKAKIQVLVATDLAARGLDVEGVSHVINYELPRDKQQYIHRVGRTGRAGAKGTAITIYSPDEARKLKALEEKLEHQFSARNIDGQELSRVEKKKPVRKFAKKPESKKPFEKTGKKKLGKKKSVK